MICPKCNELNSDKSKFCFDCNTELAKPYEPPVANNPIEQVEIQTKQIDDSQPEIQEYAKKVIIKINPNDFRSYVDNYMRKQTGFNSTQDYLNRKNPMRKIWFILFVGSIIVGGINAIGAFNNGGNALGSFLIFGVMGLGVSYVFTYLGCGIVNGIRNSKKQLLSQTAEGKVDLEGLIEFLRENLQNFSFGEWHTYKAPVLGGFIESNIDIIECVFNNKTIHRIVFVDDEPFYKICTVGIVDSAAAKTARAMAGMLGVNNRRKPNFYKLYKNSYLTLPLLEAAMECYFAVIDGTVKSVDSPDALNEQLQPIYSPVPEIFVKTKKKPRKFVLIVISLFLLIGLGRGAFFFLKSYIFKNTSVSIVEIVPLKYDYVLNFSDGLAKVGIGDREVGYKYGFIDTMGNEIIPLIYDNIWEFTEDLLLVQYNGKSGFIDKTGMTVIPFIYDGAMSFSEGLAAVSLDRKWGFIDTTGKEIISFIYDNAWSFHEGLAAVSLDGKWGFIDITGKEVIPLIYDVSWGFSEGLVSVRIGDWETGKWGFLDTTGKEIISFIYDDAWSFHEGLAAVSLDGKWGFIDTSGREIIPLKYDRVQYFSEDLIAVWLDGKCGFIDTTGTEVIPLTLLYEFMLSFSDDFISVGIGYWGHGSWGLIDLTGQEVIPLIYNSVGRFSEGLAVVTLDGKYGFVDITGKEVIPLRYDRAGSFSDGFATVALGNQETGFEWFLIDTAGNKVTPLIYDQVMSFSEGLAAVAVGDRETGLKWGFIVIK
jgi:hypothetical protein